MQTFNITSVKNVAYAPIENILFYPTLFGCLHIREHSSHIKSPLMPLNKKSIDSQSPLSSESPLRHVLLASHNISYKM